MGLVQSAIDRAMFPGPESHSSMRRKRAAVQTRGGVLITIGTTSGSTIPVATFQPLPSAQAAPASEPKRHARCAMQRCTPAAYGRDVSTSSSAEELSGSLSRRAAWEWHEASSLPWDHNVVIIYSHGNSEDLAGASACARAMADATRCTVVTYDYTGYMSEDVDVPTPGPDAPSVSGSSRALGATGGGGGVTDIQRLTAPKKRTKRQRAGHAHACADILAVYQHVRATHPSKCVILAGFSIGSGPTCWLASLRPRHVAAVVLLAAFSSSAISAIVSPQSSLPIRLAVLATEALASVFPNCTHVTKFQCPVHIFHGTEDDVISAQHADCLAGNAAKHGVRWTLTKLPGVGHNDIMYNTSVLGAMASIARFADAGV
jgi:pimeloyl-ACP methyl ester carboxylesterase